MTSQMNTASRILMVIGFVCCSLFLLRGYTAAGTGTHLYDSDHECRSCHTDVYDAWEVSAHNTSAYRGERFQAVWHSEHQSTDCLACHTTGFNPITGTVESADVGCAACHQPLDNGEYDPDERRHAQMSIPRRVEICATCHGNAHALSYSEWETSAHNGEMEVGCMSCHGPHDTGLIEDNIVDLCGSCHFQPVPVNSIHMDVDSGCENCHPAPVSVDNVHMSGDDGPVADCAACHMVPEYDERDRYLSNTGHTLEVTLTACVSCHGELHDLQASESELEANGPDQNGLP